eukprot:CAMPEP_0182429322 /NCGR_PEP_ID=MMETSP1167-20130531/25687_1 /TAXON_ID=2988 /ORGANISM="Mallomonas Sp, Strain CCMP3275" /LENGTH=407 /DNA_ID=CAMNT_0024612771 /DNA_START=224 /DNA_END=1447 /DNA_ORIENTATION=+
MEGELGIDSRSNSIQLLHDEDDVLALGSDVSTCESTNEESHETPEYVPGSFEGPEKTMEVWFRPNVGHKEGLRALSRKQLDILCTKAKCSILSKISTNYLDAYVLSESSLFVYKYKYIMKTCGTTTLLRCLGALLQYADKLGLELTWVGYSRKNLNNPHAQHYPHSSFDDEINFLSSHEKLQERLNGSGYILGPVTGDHWFVYCADHSELPLSLMAPDSLDITINMMMFDLPASVRDIFYLANTETARNMTAKAGIVGLCPGAAIDDTAFTPCGYSMNAILHETYSTIHVTPEEECSYASYETNAFLPTYLPLVRNVLSVFRPKRFVLTLFGDESALEKVELPTNSRNIQNGNSGVYFRTSSSSTKVESDLVCMMGCFSLESSSGSMKSSKSGKEVSVKKERSGSFF